MHCVKEQCHPLGMCSVPAVCAPLYLPWVPSGSTCQASLALLKALCQNFCHSSFHVSTWWCKFSLHIISTKFYSPYALTVHKSYVGFIENLHIEALKCYLSADIQDCTRKLRTIMANFRVVNISVVYYCSHMSSQKQHS